MSQPLSPTGCYKLVPVPPGEAMSMVVPPQQSQQQQIISQPTQLAPQPLQPFPQPMPFPNLLPPMASLQDNVNRLHQQMALQFPAPMMPPLMTPPQLGVTSPMSTSPMAFHTLPMPVVKQDDKGRRMVELKLDVTGYRPQDILINTDGQVLDIYARSSNSRKDGASDASSHSEFRRQFTLPEVVNAENLRCTFNNDGSLTIQSALGAQAITQKPTKHVTFALCNDS